MTGRETSGGDARILEEAGLPEDPALLYAVRDLRALGAGPAPQASAELAQLMADGGRTSQGRRNKRRITFLGGALAVSMGVGVSGVAAGTLHLPHGLGDAVDSITRFSVHHDPGRPEPALPVVAPAVEGPAWIVAVAVPAPSTVAGVPAVPVAADPTGTDDASGAASRTGTPYLPSVGGGTVPGVPPAAPAVPPAGAENPLVAPAAPAPDPAPVQNLRPAAVPGGRTPGTPTEETPPGDRGKRQGRIDQVKDQQDRNQDRNKVQDEQMVQDRRKVQDDGRGQDTFPEGDNGTGPERGQGDLRRAFVGPDRSWRLAPVEQVEEPMVLAAPVSGDDAGMSLFQAYVVEPAHDPSGDAAPPDPVFEVVPPAEPVIGAEPTAEPVIEVVPTAPVAEDG